MKRCHFAFPIPWLCHLFTDSAEAKPASNQPPGDLEFYELPVQGPEKMPNSLNWFDHYKQAAIPALNKL
jgi:hypothetical protein